MPFAKARWVDSNGRSHEWAGEVASTNRNQVISQISAQTGANSVFISGVYNDDPGSYETQRKQHIAEENERRRYQEERLKNSGKLEYFPQQRKAHKSTQSTDDTDFSGAGGLIILLGLLWAAFTFLPWVLMFAGGTAAVWIGQLLTGQTVDEYTSIEDPTNNETIRFLIVLILSITVGGWGFVQGTLWQREVQTDTTPKVEQVKPK